MCLSLCLSICVSLCVWLSVYVFVSVSAYKPSVHALSRDGVYAFFASTCIADALTYLASPQVDDFHSPPTDVTAASLIEIADGQVYRLDGFSTHQPPTILYPFI